MKYCTIERVPDRVEFELEDKKVKANNCGNQATFEDICLKAENGAIFLSAKETPIKKAYLRWNGKLSCGVKILGDAFERAYANLEWRGIMPERAMPWYALVNAGEETVCYGVEVQPNAFCIWHIDNDGVTLILDVCNGAKGVLLAGRELRLCKILSAHYENMTAFDAGVAFCKAMCTNGVFPKEKVYGYNNWYYAYGKSSQEELIEDADYLVELTKDLSPRPYFVIDDCWEKNWKYAAGPWDELADTFYDMKKLADDIKARDLKPGIWLRPLYYWDKQFPDAWKLHDYGKDGVVLDITVPEAREYVLHNFAVIKEWGYELIKHDYSTYDIFDMCYFREQTDTMSKGEWTFSDRSKTNAEIILEFYRDIKKTVGDCVVIGCNTVSHFAAGIFEIQRTGDDTSGKSWDRTRKFGFNTLAFRMIQHNVFYTVDADCIGITAEVPWEYNKKWLEVLAKSGTPMFVSTKKGVANAEQIETLKEAFAINAKQENVCIPLNWQDTVCPDEWLIDGEKMEYDLFEK